MKRIIFIAMIFLQACQSANNIDVVVDKKKQEKKHYIDLEREKESFIRFTECIFKALEKTRREKKNYLKECEESDIKENEVDYLIKNMLKR